MSKFRLYLTPNFSNHPLNFLALLVVFIGAFSFASLAQAFEDDGTYDETLVYHYGNGFYWPTMTELFNSRTPAGWKALNTACAQDGFLEIPKAQVSCINKYGSIGKIIGIQTQACVSTQGELGAACALTPSANCPAKFTAKRIVIPINGIFDDNGQFVMGDNGSDHRAKYAASYHGCKYVHRGTYAETDSLDSNFTYGCNKDKQCFMHGTYVSTGDAVDPVESVASAVSEDDEYFIDETTLSEAQKTESETVVDTPPTTVTDANGSQVTVSSKIETLIRDSGVQVVAQDETAVVTQSDGMKKTVTTTTTDIVYPDGSKDVITERKVSYEQSDKTVFVVDIDGRKTVTNIPGSAASNAEKTTDTYDAEGNKTGSSTESSSDGDGEAEEAQEGDECKEDPDSCKEGEFKKGDKGVFDNQVANDALDAALAEYDTKFSEVKDGVMNAFSVNFTGGGGSISGSEISWRGTDINRSNNAVRWFDYIDMGSIVMLIAALAAAFILLRRNG